MLVKAEEMFGVMIGKDYGKVSSYKPNVQVIKHIENPHFEHKAILD